MTSSPASGVEPPKKKRLRFAKSCEPCRSRKVRCDQEFPCGPCQRSRDRLTCAYRNPMSRPGAFALPVPAPVPAPVSGPGPTLSAPVAGVTALHDISRFELGDDDHVRSTTTLSAATRRMDAEPGASADVADATSQKFRRLEGRIRHLEDQVASLRSAEGGRDATDSPQPCIQRPKPRLRFTQDKVRLFGQSHWVHTAEKVIKFGTFDADVEPVLSQERADIAKAAKGLKRLRQSLRAQQQLQAEAPIDLSDTNQLPAREVCDALVASYLRTFERMYRILNIPKFLEQIAQFWENPGSLPKCFSIKYALILAAATPFTPSTRHMDQSNHQARQWIYAAQSWLAMNEKSTKNLQGLQAFCLLIIARQANGLGSSPFFSTTSLLSLAIQMGLDRDTQDFPGLSNPQAEFMARMWATVVELSLVSCLEDGTDISKGLEAFGARPPSNINDVEMTDGAVLGPISASDGRITDVSIQQMLSRSQQLRMEALKIINGRSQVSYNSVVDLANRIRRACTEASNFFACYAVALGPEAAFHRKYIDMYLRKHILLLHRPFMLEAREDSRFYLSSKICLDTCMIMASYADEMNLPSPGLDDFSSMMVHGSGHLRGSLTLDVIITLVYELNTQFQEEGASQGPIPGDPAHEAARMAREPIVRRLEHIRKQLCEIIRLGLPTTKRFVMTSALLAQVKALETGDNVRSASVDAVKESTQICTESLEPFLANDEGQAQRATAIPPAEFEEFDFDFGDMDFENFLDPLLFFNPPANGGSSMEFEF